MAREAQRPFVKVPRAIRWTPFAVGVHMVLAALTAAAMTLFILRMKRPVDAPAELAAGAESR